MAHVVRPLEVAKVLRTMGYEVIFAGDGKAMNLVRVAGFELYPLPELDVNWMIAHIYDGHRVLHPVNRIDTWVKAELALFKKIKPDAILDDLRITGGISTDMTNIPRITIQNAHGTKYALTCLNEITNSGPPPVFSPGIEVTYNEVREKLGLEPVETYQDLLNGSLNLLCDIPEYAPTTELPPNYHYIGPITWNPDIQPPEWMGNIEPDRPTIYFTMGSTGPTEAFRVGINAFGNTQYQVMMTVGSRVNVGELQPIPPNIFTSKFGPGEKLAKKADVVICHGGNGTTYQALSMGRPIITLPLLADQRWNAQRQLELGVGKTLPAPTPGAMKAVVEEVLNDPKYKATAEYMGSLIAKYQGPQTAARLIEEYLTIR